MKDTSSDNEAFQSNFIGLRIFFLYQVNFFFFFIRRSWINTSALIICLRFKLKQTQILIEKLAVMAGIDGKLLGPGIIGTLSRYTDIES